MSDCHKFDRGESVYINKLNDDKAKSNEQLRVDTDYIAIMSGVEL